MPKKMERGDTEKCSPSPPEKEEKTTTKNLGQRMKGRGSLQTEEGSKRVRSPPAVTRPSCQTREEKRRQKTLSGDRGVKTKVRGRRTEPPKDALVPRIIRLARGKWPDLKRKS